MKRFTKIIIIIGLMFLLASCDSIEHHETDQFELLIFNGNISIVGYKEGYYSEDLVIDQMVTYYNTKTGKLKSGYINRIDDNAFQNEDIASIKINPSENSIFNQILDYAFADNYNLTRVELPPSILEISNFVFSNSVSLQSIDLQNVKYLGDSVFYNCLMLNEIYLGSEIVSIGNNTFENCDDNLVIYINNPTPPQIGDNIFQGVESFSIVVPQMYLETYKAAIGWSLYVSHIFPQE